MRFKPQTVQLVTVVALLAASHAVPLNRLDIDGNMLRLDGRNGTSFDREFSNVCVIDDVLYQRGDPVPPTTACERCTCQPPTIACSPLQCEYKPNCKALKMSDQCCTIYQCECEHKGQVYQNGERLENPENPCDVCYCRGGQVSCTSIECYKRDDCVPQIVPGRCCPKYDHCPPTDQSRPEKARPYYVRTDYTPAVQQRNGLLDLDNEASEDVTATALPTQSLVQHDVTHTTVGTSTTAVTLTNIIEDEARLTADNTETHLSDSTVGKLIPVLPEDSSEEGSGTTPISEEKTTEVPQGRAEVDIANGEGEGSGTDEPEQKTEANIITTLSDGRGNHETELTTQSANVGIAGVTEISDKDITTEGFFVNLRSNADPTSESQEEGTGSPSDSTGKPNEVDSTTTETYSSESAESREHSEESSSEKELQEATTVIILPEASQKVQHDSLPNNDIPPKIDEDASESKTEISVELATSEPPTASVRSSIENTDNTQEGIATEAATATFTDLEGGLPVLPIEAVLANNAMNVVLAMTEDTTSDVSTDSQVAQRAYLYQGDSLQKQFELTTEQSEIPTIVVDLTTVIPSGRKSSSDFGATDNINYASSTTDASLLEENTQEIKSLVNDLVEIGEGDLTTLPSEIEEVTVVTEKSETDVTTSQPDGNLSKISQLKLDISSPEESSSSTETPKEERSDVTEEVSTILPAESETTSLPVDVLIRLASETSSVDVEHSAIEPRTESPQGEETSTTADIKMELMQQDATESPTSQGTSESESTTSQQDGVLPGTLNLKERTAIKLVSSEDATTPQPTEELSTTMETITGEPSELKERYLQSEELHSTPGSEATTIVSELEEGLPSTTQDIRSAEESTTEESGIKSEISTEKKQESADEVITTEGSIKPEILLVEQRSSADEGTTQGAETTKQEIFEAEQRISADEGTTQEAATTIKQEIFEAEQRISADEGTTEEPGTTIKPDVSLTAQRDQPLQPVDEGTTEGSETNVNLAFASLKTAESSETSSSEHNSLSTDSEETTTKVGIEDATKNILEESTTKPQAEDTTHIVVEGRSHEVSTVVDPDLESTTLPRDWLKSDSSADIPESTTEAKSEVKENLVDVSEVTEEEVTPTEKSAVGSGNHSVSDNSTVTEEGTQHVAKARSVDNLDITSGDENSFISSAERLSRSSESYNLKASEDDFFTRLFHHRDVDQAVN